MLTHAVIDALLGAAGLDDIGRHFPDTDPRYAGADSLVLLRTALAAVEAEGWAVTHVDATVVMERPKLAPHRDAIRDTLAGVLGSIGGGSTSRPPPAREWASWGAERASPRWPSRPCTRPDAGGPAAPGGTAGPCPSPRRWLGLSP